MFLKLVNNYEFICSAVAYVKKYKPVFFSQFFIIV